jgi:hypothetical protein
MKVSWDDYPTYYGKIKSNHHPVVDLSLKNCDFP